MRRLPASDTRALSEDRTRPVADAIPLARATAGDDRGSRPTELAADDRPRVIVPLEERLSQPAPTPSLQDRLSQPAVPARVDIGSAPSLEERLSSGPVPPRTYPRSASVARDDLRAPLPVPKDDPRDHDRITDLRTNRDFSRERPAGPLPTASTYRPDVDRNFGDRDRRDRDVADIDAPPARYGDGFSRPGLPHAGIRHLHPHSCSIATVSGKGEDPTTRRVRRRLPSALKVYMIPMGREGIPPIENATPMNSGGGIGTHLATTTGVDHHRPRRGDHTRGRRLRIGTGSDSTVRETETETYASVIGIGTWADWHRRPHQQEGIGTNAIDGLGSHSRNHRDWTQRV